MWDSAEAPHRKHGWFKQFVSKNAADRTKNLWRWARHPHLPRRSEVFCRRQGTCGDQPPPSEDSSPCSTSSEAEDEVHVGFDPPPHQWKPTKLRTGYAL